MTREHWFDTLNKLLTHHAPRRGVLGAFALTSNLCRGATDAAAKNGGKGGKNNGKGNKGNSNGKKKGKNPKKAKKPKKPPPPPPPCSDGACNREFVFEDNRTWCEFICRQCDGDDPRDFCIVWADATDPNNHTKIADCCENGEKCCGATCCPEGRVCCGGERCCPVGHTCCDDGHCCPTDNPYYTCCDGQCWNTEYAQAHCGACGNPCAAGEVCQAGQCLCSDDCGEDECLNCPPGQFCHDGINCSCGNGFKYCPIGERCIREEWACCGGPQSVTGYCFYEEQCCGSGVDAYCRASTTPTCP